MKVDDAGNLDFFMDEEEGEPIVESAIPEETHPDMVVPTEAVDTKAVVEEPVIEAGAKTLEDTGKKEEVPPVEDEVERKRYEYWQSKHDQLKTDYDKVKTQAEISGDYAPIAEYLYNNPQAMLKLQESLTESAPGKPSGPQTPVAPVKPEQPAGYSKYEAMQEPEGVHAKYETALMNYQTDMLDYMNDRQQFIEDKTNYEMQATMQREQQLRQQEQFKSELLSNGLDAAEYSDFMDKLYTDPISRDPKNLINYYRKILVADGVTKASVQKKEFEKQQERIMNNPPPAGGEGGEATHTPTDEELFNHDLLNWKR